MLSPEAIEELKKNIIKALTDSDDDDGFERDAVESKRLTDKFLEIVQDIENGDIDGYDIAQFINDEMKWRY